MKRDPWLQFLIIVLLGLTFAGRFGALATGVTNPPPKCKIDGVFEDWSAYQVAWSETGFDWSKAKMTPAFDGIDLKEFYYDNDETYLYLFIKCKPTLQERYDETHRTAMLGYLYIDSDMNTNTGAADRDADGAWTVSGAEIQIYLPTGFSSAEGKKSDCLLIYDMKRWDVSSKLFDQRIRKAESSDSDPLVAHGKDGVEMALLLSDLGVQKGGKFSLACWESRALRNINKTSIQIK